MLIKNVDKNKRLKMNNPALTDGAIAYFNAIRKNLATTSPIIKISAIRNKNILASNSGKRPGSFITNS